MQSFINTLVRVVGCPSISSEIANGQFEDMSLELTRILSAALADKDNQRVSFINNRDGRLVEVTRSYYDRGHLAFQRWTLV